MHLGCPRERTVPQRLKPATTVTFTARLKPCPSKTPMTFCFDVKALTSKPSSLVDGDQQWLGGITTIPETISIGAAGANRVLPTG